MAQNVRSNTIKLKQNSTALMPYTQKSKPNNCSDFPEGGWKNSLHYILMEMRDV